MEEKKEKPEKDVVADVDKGENEEKPEVRRKMEHVLVPREKDRKNYYRLTDAAKERRRKLGLDEDYFSELIAPEKLVRFKELVEERYKRDFFEVADEVIKLKVGLRERAQLLFFFAKAVNDDEVVDEKDFVESCTTLSPNFTFEALRTMIDAVRDGGVTPILWRVDALCRRR